MSPYRLLLYSSDLRGPTLFSEQQAYSDKSEKSVYTCLELQQSKEAIVRT